MTVQELATSTGANHPNGLDSALQRIAARAGELDSHPRFPAENFADLAAAGVLDSSNGAFADEVRLVRRVAGADASTARILDGHLNGLERLRLTGAVHLPRAELAELEEGGLLVGVWGADPAAREGPPARLEKLDGRLVLRGMKTFCSGAGGVQRALVVASERAGVRRLVYVDPTSQVGIDPGWYRASGLRSSESHLVEFHDTPVITVLGGPDELSREPYFSRDAIRTSATWAGLADCILAETRSALDPSRLDAAQAHRLGRMRVAQSTIDRWLEHTTAVLSGPPDSLRAVDSTVLAAECRVALYASASLIARQAARVCGSRALIGASTLDRARRDLDLFLLQHRLDPKITTLGAELLGAEGG